jgi:hypothetical protein
MRQTFQAMVIAAAIVMSLVLAQPAGAIQYGEPDNGAHPYVGGLVYQYGDATFVGCSGTLIGPTTFLTAAHCVPDESFQLIGVTSAEAYVSGESTAIPLLDNSAFIQYPTYDGSPYADVAVVLLRYDPGVGYGALPELGLLDTLAPSAKPGNQARYLTAVGYGTTGLNRGAGGPPEFVYPDMKMRGENRIIGLNNARLGGLLVQTTAAPGTGGGTCYGDSGGPFFLAGTNIVVAIPITGSNPNCGGNDISLRIDTADVLAFLGS